MLDEDVATTEPDTEAEASEPKPARDYEVIERRASDVVWVITIAVFGIVFGAAVIGNWQRSQNVDPMYAYDILLRTLRYGGTYYQNGIHNKGPLEIFTFQAASWITSRDGFWYGISFFIAVGALIIGFAAARTAQAFGGGKEIAVAAAAVVFVHLTLGPSDYAGVLYARNMTTPLLAIGWTIALWDRAWTTRRRALAAAIVSGALLGIAVQTLTTTAFVASAVSLVTLALLRQRRPKPDYALVDTAFVASGALAFLSAPIWYLLRGRFTEFFSGWFTYARFMSVGTGRSLGAQFALGWDQIYAYYEHRPLAFLVVVGFAVMLAIDWPQATPRQRVIALGLLGWFAGAWMELILSQRYSSHYFVVSTVPTALMAAGIAGRLYYAFTEHRTKVRGAFAIPLVALVLAIYLSGPKLFVQDMHDLSSFTSVHQHAVQVDQSQAGNIRSTRAVLDLVSKDWDPVLIWTNDPWPYLDYHRISATRFIWKSFLTGEIYLGNSGPQYVLPHSTQWFHEDLQQSKPAAYLKSNGGDIPARSAFAQYIAQNFTTVYPDGDAAVRYRNDVAAQMLAPATNDAWTAPEPPADGSSGWSVTNGGVQFRDQGGRDTDRLTLSNQSCIAISGNVSSDGPPGGLVFWFDDNAHQAEETNLDFDGDHVSAGSSQVEYYRLPGDLSVAGTTPTKFTLIVGRRAAGLVVNGQVRAAVRLPKSVTVHVASQRSILNVTNLRTGPAPAITGC